MTTHHTIQSDELHAIQKSFENASKASHALVDQTLSNVLTVLSVTPGKRKWISNPNWIQQRNDTIWIDAMNILIQKLIAINPEKYWVSFSDEKDEESIRKNMDNNNSIIIDELFRTVLEGIKWESLNSSRDKFQDQYKDVHSASLAIDEESSTYIWTTLDESIEEHQKWIYTHITRALKVYQEDQNKRLNHELLVALEQRLWETKTAEEKLENEYQSNINTLNEERVTLGRVLKQLNLSDRWAVETIRSTADSLEWINHSIDNLITSHNKAIEENKSTQDAISTEIAALKKELIPKDNPTLNTWIVSPVVEQSAIPPETKKNSDSTVRTTAELWQNELSRAFEDAYGRIIMNLSKGSPESIAYMNAWNELQNIHSSTKQKKDAITAFITAVDKSSVLTMQGYEGVYIEEVKGILRKSTWRLAPNIPLEEVFKKIIITKSTPEWTHWPESVSKSDL